MPFSSTIRLSLTRISELVNQLADYFRFFIDLWLENAGAEFRRYSESQNRVDENTNDFQVDQRNEQLTEDRLKGFDVSRFQHLDSLL